MTLWDWAVAAWSRPGVETACLALQDEESQSVALILWRAWCVHEGRAVDASTAQRACILTRPVEDNQLRPLRASRRALARREDMERPSLRAAELAIEKGLLESLEALSGAPGHARSEDTGAALIGLMETWSGRPPGETARSRAAMLSGALA